MLAIPLIPSTAKKLTYDISTQTLHLNPLSPTPTLDFAKDDHLILVNATALCKGELTWPTVNPTALFSENPNRDIIPGYDVSGIIIASPPNSCFKPGDEIIAQTRFNRPGNCRECSIARSQEMAPKPANLSWAEAASIPISALTAWQALFQHAGVKGLDNPDLKGKRILVIAAAGSVGIWLVQLAKLAGLKIVAQVGSLENEKLVRDLGATEVINYKTTSLRGWASQHSPVDIVFDLLGGLALEEAWYCVKDKGYLVSIVDEPKSHRPVDFRSKGVKNEFFIVESDGQQLAEISRMVNHGLLTTIVDSIWKLEDYAQAFTRLEGGHPRGKVVIQVNK